MAFKKLVVSGGVSDLCSTNVMSVKLMMEVSWFLHSIENLQITYPAMMKGEFCNCQV